MMATDTDKNTSIVLNVKIVLAYYDNITYKTTQTVGGYFDLYYS